MIMEMDLQRFLDERTTFNINTIDVVFDRIRPFISLKPGNGCRYINLPMAFDTEFSSFRDEHDKKVGLMYVWMIGICGMAIVGRTFDELKIVCDKISTFFQLSGNVRCIMYVHFLGADFEYIRHHFEWDKIFAMEPHDPVYAITSIGIEFRCSYHLSGYKLERVGNKLNKYHCEKLVGQLDYRLIRTPDTPLSNTELDYCINDVKVLCAYIQEEIERNNNDITQIPLTKTGYVRRFARESCFKNKYRYQSLMRSLTITADEFKMLHNGFQGGFTHSNPCNTRIVLEDVTGIDISSSYPAALASERMPMGKGKCVHVNSKDEFKSLIKSKHCVFEVCFEGLHSNVYFDSYISESKCRVKEKWFSQNGRIVYASRIITTITEVDFQVINTVYNWDRMIVGNIWVYDSDYLPSEFIHAMLTLYQQKTMMKGIPELEYEYNKIKEDQNSFYGMTVTSPIRDIIPYDDEWGKPVTPELNEALKIYNRNHQRFLFYPWGVYTTAYARRNVWSAILECSDDHVYSDTDSEKFLNYDKHKQYIANYNKLIQSKLQRACKCHGISFEYYCRPKNNKGVVKPLGVWDFDAHYKRFKTLGAKRYLYELDDGSIHYVVAGAKREGIKWMENHYDDVFEAFDDGLTIPAGESGRITHTYINERRQGIITDYMGNDYEYDVLSALHMEESEYSLSMAESYMDYILDIRTVETE